MWLNVINVMPACRQTGNVINVAECDELPVRRGGDIVATIKINLYRETPALKGDMSWQQILSLNGFWKAK